MSGKPSIIVLGGKFGVYFDCRYTNAAIVTYRRTYISDIYINATNAVLLSNLSTKLVHPEIHHRFLFLKRKHDHYS